MAKGKKTGGRTKGAVNHFTRSVREVITDAFHEMQLKPGVNMLEWGERNPTEFYRLASKLIPLQVANDPDNPMPGMVIQIVPDTQSQPIHD